MQYSLQDESEDPLVKPNKQSTATPNTANTSQESILYQEQSPFRDSTFFKKLIFGWVFPIVKYAKDKPLSIDLFGYLRDQDKVEHQAHLMRESWKKYKRHNSPNDLFKAVLHAFRKEYLIAMCISVVSSGFELSTPFIIKAIIDFIQDPTLSNVHGFSLILLLIITQTVSYVLQEHVDFYSRMIGVKSTNSLVSLIYKKQLKVSNATNKKFSQGEIMNFVQVDAAKLQLISESLSSVAKLPIVLIICFSFLFYYLGASMLTGIIVFIVAFIMNLLIGKASAKLQKEIMKRQDVRINATTESLNNIKMLKLYSLTDNFEKKIDDARENELMTLWKRLKLGIMSITGLYFFPQILGAVVFSTYIGSGNTLELSIAYTVITIFSIVKAPIRTLPNFLGNAIEFIVAMRRIQEFLICQEINTSIVYKQEFEEASHAIEIQNGNFFWGLAKQEEKPKTPVVQQEESKQEEQSEVKTLNSSLILKDLNLKIKHGEFVCVIGDVGSGKSSFLSSIIGDLLHLQLPFLLKYGNSVIQQKQNDQDALVNEIKKHTTLYIEPQDSPIKTGKNISYVQQMPWIQNKTIKDNILFGLPYDEDRYNETIELCELERDLEILPAADLTEIGEKGINLSGGQKARVSLARAVYADNDVILMDDPISALDANVKKKIFQNVFLEKFKNKTRVLVTHAIDFLHLVDRIVLIHQGKIVLEGKYEELKDNPYIHEIIKIHHSHNFTTTKGSENPTVINLADIKSIEQFEEMKSDSESSEGEISNDEDDLDLRMNKIRSKKKKKRSYSVQGSSSLEQGKIIEDENKDESKVDLNVYKQYLKYYGGVKIIFWSQLSMCLFIVFKIMNDYWVGQWAVSADQHSRFGFYCSLYFLFSVLTTMCVFARCVCFQGFTWYASRQIHKDMMNKVLKAPINIYFDVTPIGRILNKFSKDLTVVETQMSYVIGSVNACFYQALSVLIVAIVAIYWVALIIPIMLYLQLKLYKFAINAYRETTRLESVSKSPLLSFLAETCNGASTIRAFGKQKEFIKQNNKLLNQNIVACMTSQAVQNWFSLRLSFVSIVVFAFSASFCIVYRDGGNQVMLSLMMTYILQLQEMSIWTVRCFAILEQKMVNVDRCLKMMEIPQESDDVKEEYKSFFKINKDWPKYGAVEFKNVVLKYRPNLEVALKNLTFETKPGEKIGVVGRTGAGKSTICLSLSRIVEIIEGCILIDNIDIRELPLNEIRSRITVIPQDPTMFTGTLKYNLDPENKYDDEKCVSLLRRAKLEELLNKDSKGIHQLITENGSNLSSGEKQLICICRAILRSSKVVILDEATANIDVVTEQKIQELISSEFKDSTMITIAHRLNTIINSDRVLVLSYGQIKEYDSPETLMKNPDSEFSKLLKELKKKEQ